MGLGTGVLRRALEGWSGVWTSVDQSVATRRNNGAIKKKVLYMIIQPTPPLVHWTIRATRKFVIFFNTGSTFLGIFQLKPGFEQTTDSRSDV